MPAAVVGSEPERRSWFSPAGLHFLVHPTTREQWPVAQGGGQDNGGGWQTAGEMAEWFKAHAWKA